MQRSRRLLVCDLDGTFLGDRKALETLTVLLGLDGAPLLAFATGRQYASATALLGQWNVSDGAFLIAGVGSEMYARQEDRWRPLAWPPVADAWSAARVRTVLDAIPDIALQPVCSAVKVSYYADSSQVDGVRRALEDAGLGANVIHSHGELLDVLPPGVHKGAAVKSLALANGVDLRDVMTCGDTENDVAMLELPGPSVIVGNACSGLRARAARMPNVYISAGRCANGIVEGLRRYGWLTPDGWTRSNASN